ncbi:MAG: pyridoxal-phosphate dependent enzyme [Chlamydiia bacterium]|nr:pyridoxal-phosphate dependent enzyme [Chlamydiia bacterium]
MIQISLHEFHAAARFMRKKGLYTPLVAMPFTQGKEGQQILLKGENLQPSGSFKIRGATWCLHHLPDRYHGVIAYSTGNHAQAVSLAASQRGVDATIVMLPSAKKSKVEATRRLGGKVIFHKDPNRSWIDLAKEIASEEERLLISPYDHPLVITGQGTIGIEIMQQTHPGAIFVPVGGGGLIAGIASAVKRIAPDVLLIGVEPAWEDDAYRSFQCGFNVNTPNPSKTAADAVIIERLGSLTYPLFCHFVDDMITVGEEAIMAATTQIIEESHLFVEPCGALALAGALSYPKPLPLHRPIVCIASGGNA